MLWTKPILSNAYIDLVPDSPGESRVVPWTELRIKSSVNLTLKVKYLNRNLSYFHNLLGIIFKFFCFCTII